VARLKAGVKPTAEDLALLTEAARTAQHAFEEVGAANDALDDASGLGENLTTALAETLRRRARAEVPAPLGALRTQATRRTLRGRPYDRRPHPRQRRIGRAGRPGLRPRSLTWSHSRNRSSTGLPRRPVHAGGAGRDGPGPRAVVCVPGGGLKRL
jgi:hypothetical protein